MKPKSKKTAKEESESIFKLPSLQEAEKLLEKELSNGEKIPTLQAYLKAGKKQKNTKLILEMKTSVIGKERTIALSTACVEMVKKFKMDQWIEYISFDYDALLNIRKLNPTAITYYLTGDIASDKLKYDGITGADYHYSVFEKDPTWFTKARSLGLKLNAWTVNSVPVMEWLLKNEVEFITTNEPEMLFGLLKK
ncbi:MAG: hypothetical protein EOP48_21105 [Sphingobacteriales bacterium]|nr:MAG: hypothetical protein EOP48_21105 [Sphingobacteriales bacterium]